MTGYKGHARAGIDSKRPPVETFPNQFPAYTITIADPEYNAICPKTGLPDFGTVTIAYEPDRRVIELKSLKMYMTAFRNVGIFYENAVNVILRDLVKACDPVWMTVTGRFNARGGLSSTVEARYDRNQRR